LQKTQPKPPLFHRDVPQVDDAGRMQVLMADLRMVIENSKTEGENQDDLMHTFKDYKPFEVGQALNALIKDGQIKLAKHRLGENRYFSTDPRVVTVPKQELETYRAKAQELISYIEPFPGPLTPAQTFSSQHFHKYKQGMSTRVVEGHEYIGVPTTAILKTFRPELTERLAKLGEKWFSLKPGSPEYEELKQRYDDVTKSATTEVEKSPTTGASLVLRWKLVGVVPQAKATKSGLGYDFEDAAVFISCKTGQVTQVNARYIHIVEDVCDNVRYYSHGPEYMMAVECNGERVMVTMPLTTPLIKGVQEAMTELLC